ncbi:hypothetical protein ANO14919_081340 [Xylariales sp. No.14919]|nr:hypothetical protein ANO14919_081340 [Xylariales sp. No.14919]
MKFLAAPVLFTGIAQGLPAAVKRQDPCPFTVDIPADTYYKVGDDLNVTWNPDALPEGTIQLQVYSQLITPIITGYVYNWYGKLIPVKDFHLASKQLGFTDLKERSYTWQVEVLGNATGPEYVYTVGGTYVLHYGAPGYGDTTDYCTIPQFHVSAA